MMKAILLEAKLVQLEQLLFFIGVNPEVRVFFLLFFTNVCQDILVNLLSPEVKEAVQFKWLHYKELHVGNYGSLWYKSEPMANFSGKE